MSDKEQAIIEIEVKKYAVVLASLKDYYGGGVLGALKANVAMDVVSNIDKIVDLERELGVKS